METLRRREIFAMPMADLIKVRDGAAEDFPDEEREYADYLLHEFEKHKKVYDGYCERTEYKLYAMIKGDEYPKIEQEYAQQRLDILHSHEKDKFITDTSSSKVTLFNINQQLKVIKGCVIFFTILTALSIIFGIILFCWGYHELHDVFRILRYL